MTPYETIRIAGAMLQNGESDRCKCPWCNGGGTAEKSFVMTRDGNSIKYNCFRATCGNNSAGVLSLTGSPTKMSDYKHKPRSRDYTNATSMLTAANRVYMHDSFGLTTKMLEEYRIKQDDQNRVVIPLYNANGVQQGHEVKRGISNCGGPKSLLYHGDSSDGMAWFTGAPAYPTPKLNKAIPLQNFYSNSCVLVEDAISAMKVNAFINSIALLGVNLNKENAHAIAMKNYERVYLALDADASSKALSIAKRMRGILPNLRVMLLKKDIKNMPYDDIAMLLSIHHRRV